MGTLKLRNVKHKTHLMDSITYIMQESKTENGQFIFGDSGYTPEMVYDTFQNTKRFYDKRDGRQAYHYILTFAEEDVVPPELAKEITEQFMMRLFQENEFDWVGSVHTDTMHLHSHIIFNSLNRNTGYKYRYEKGDWEKKIQRIADDLCNKHGLTTIAYDYDVDGKAIPKEKPEKSAENYLKHKNEEIARKANLICQDVDRCIALASSYEDFLSLMKQDGYSIRRQGTSKKYGEYITLKPYGADGGLRSYRLGKNYSPQRIKERIKQRRNEQSIVEEPLSDEEYKRIIELSKIKTVTYRKFYVKHIYIAKRWKNRRPFPNSYLYKTAIIDNQKMMEEYKLIKSLGFQTQDEIVEYISAVEREIRNLYTIKKKVPPESDERSFIEGQIKEYRFNKNVAKRLLQRISDLPVAEKIIERNNTQEKGGKNAQKG